MTRRGEVIRDTHRNPELRPHRVAILRPSWKRVAARFICMARERDGEIPFPPDYKDVLCSGGKTMTVRVDEEVGIYQEGNVYRATSYEGEPWGVRVRIVSVTPLQATELADHGIPEEDILRILAEADSPDQVELVQFDVL